MGSRWFWGWCVGLVCWAASVSVGLSAEDKETGSSPVSAADKHALEVGRKVIRLREALKKPGSAEAAQAVQDLGTDSRYYVMVRGWIVQHKHMAESYRDVSSYRSSEEYRKGVDARIAALSKLLRRIDLE